MFGTTANACRCFLQPTLTASVVISLCWCILKKMQIHKDKDREKPSYHESSKSRPPLSKTLAGSGAPWIALNNHQEIRRRHSEFSLEQPANVQLYSPSSASSSSSSLGPILWHFVSPLAMSHCGGFISSAA